MKYRILSVVFTSLLVSCTSARSVIIQSPVLSLQSNIIRTINQESCGIKDLDQPITVTGIDKYLGEGEWHFVWSTPQNAEPGVFILHGTENDLHCLTVWGGVAFPEEESEILNWFQAQAPGAPTALLKKVAYDVTHEKR
jgi:hypothetical protein